MAKNANARKFNTPATSTAAPAAALMHAATTTPAPADLVRDQDAAQDEAPAEQPSPLSIAGNEQPTVPAAPEQQPAPQLAGSEDAAPVAAQPAPLAALPAPVFTPEPRAPRSIDELIELVGQGQALTGRLAGLRTTAEKLGSFTIGREGFNDRLTIRDGAGIEWNTSQSTIIQKVLNVLRAELRDAIGSTEGELRHLLPAA